MVFKIPNAQNTITCSYNFISLTVISCFLEWFQRFTKFFDQLHCINCKRNRGLTKKVKVTLEMPSLFSPGYGAGCGAEQVYHNNCRLLYGYLKLYESFHQNDLLQTFQMSQPLSAIQIDVLILQYRVHTQIRFSKQSKIIHKKLSNMIKFFSLKLTGKFPNLHYTYTFITFITFHGIWEFRVV